jgi:hypothetical protein
MCRIKNAAFLASWLAFQAAGPAADFNVVNNGVSSYLINSAVNPTLTLIRGQTYTFSIAASGHPFWIKTNGVTGTGSSYANGVTGNGTDVGTLIFSVPFDAPNSLFYNCQFHSTMKGSIVITNPPPTAAVLSNPRIPAPGQFRFDVAGTPGRAHVIEASNGLPGGWTPLSTNTPAGAAFTFTDNAAAGSRRLYRVITR